MKTSFLRASLLASVSLVALVAQGTAHADEATFPSGFWVSSEGKYLFADGTAQPILAPGRGLAPLPGQSDRIHSAYSFGLAVGGPLPAPLALPGWDFRFAYTGIRSEHHSTSAHAASATFTTPFLGPPITTTHSTDFSSAVSQGFDIGDFDVGHDYGLGGVDGRVSFGVRFVSFNQRTTGVLGGEGTNTVEQACSHFFGGGPRIGYDGSYPLGMVGPVKVGLAGNVAGAVLFGSAYHKASVVGTLGNGGENGDETGLTQAVNAEASLGVSFALPVYSSEAKLTVGYGGQAWLDILDTEMHGEALAGTAGTRRGDQFFNGPFINIGMKW